MTIPPNPDAVRRLRDRAGCGLKDAADALVWAGGNELLAEGYVHYRGCAVRVKPQNGETEAEAYDRWVERMARKWAGMP